MSFSVGVDIIEIERVQQAVERYAQRFLQRIYTERELALCKGRPPELAARFAGKEAVSKVLGTGFAGISWREIEILSDALGKPTVRLAGRALRRAEQLGIHRVEISLSHSRDYALAFAIGHVRGDPE